MKYKDEVAEKLKQIYSCKLELHAHTSPVSPCGNFSPQDAVRKYKALGFDAIAITNHFTRKMFEAEHMLFEKQEIINFYLNDYYRAAEEGEKVGIKVILGSEIRFTDCNNDYLIFGLEEKDFDYIFDAALGDIKTFYREFSSPEHIIIQAHPFRNGQVVMPPDTVDAYEGVNLHACANSKIGLAVKMANERKMIYTAGTDFHDDGEEGIAAVRVAKVPENSKELAVMLKNNDFVIDLSSSILIP